MLIVSYQQNEGGGYVTHGRSSNRPSIDSQSPPRGSPKFLIQAELLYKKDKYYGTGFKTMLPSATGLNTDSKPKFIINSQGREPMPLSVGGPQIMSDKLKGILAEKVDATLQSQNPYETRPDLI